MIMNTVPIPNIICSHTSLPGKSRDWITEFTIEIPILAVAPSVVSEVNPGTEADGVVVAKPKSMQCPLGATEVAQVGKARASSFHNIHHPVPIYFQWLYGFTDMYVGYSLNGNIDL